MLSFCYKQALFVDFGIATHNRLNLLCSQVQFLGAVTKTQPYMIVTEYMTGGSLLDLFKSRRGLSTWRSIQLCLDCARGMAYLHNRSPQAVVHRDLKPANIML